MRYATPNGSYQLSELPGCSQVVVSHGAWVLPHLRNKGIGSSEHEARLAKMQEMNFDVGLCTVDAANVPQIAILKKYHWQCVFEFPSSKTGNTVQIWVNSVQAS
jgi:RimJ/RimL family protein N-acetyltransferase